MKSLLVTSLIATTLSASAAKSAMIRYEFDYVYTKKEISVHSRYTDQPIPGGQSFDEFFGLEYRLKDEEPTYRGYLEIRLDNSAYVTVSGFTSGHIPPGAYLTSIAISPYRYSIYDRNSEGVDYFTGKYQPFYMDKDGIIFEKNDYFGDLRSLVFMTEMKLADYYIKNLDIGREGSYLHITDDYSEEFHKDGIFGSAVTSYETRAQISNVSMRLIGEDIEENLRQITSIVDIRDMKEANVPSAPNVPDVPIGGALGNFLIAAAMLGALARSGWRRSRA